MSTARLENWSLFGEGALYGDIYEDKKHRWPDGHNIKVSRLTPKDQTLVEGNVVHTVNSSYLLGKQAGGD